MFPSCLHLISRRNRTQSWALTRQLPRLATIGQKKPCLSTCRDFMVSNVHFDCQGRNFLVFWRITDDLIRFCALSPVAMLKQLSQAQLNRRVLIDVMSDATPCDHFLIQVLWQLFWLLSYYLKVSCSCTVYSILIFLPFKQCSNVATAAGNCFFLLQNTLKYLQKERSVSLLCQRKNQLNYLCYTTIIKRLYVRQNIKDLPLYMRLLKINLICLHLLYIVVDIARILKYIFDFTASHAFTNNVKSCKLKNNN